MKLLRKGQRHAHRGIIGIEAAIVLIAFVIVAAALAFVVLNMGFATTQKVKTSITSALGEAGSSMQVSSKIIGHSISDLHSTKTISRAVYDATQSGGWRPFTPFSTPSCKEHAAIQLPFSWPALPACHSWP